MFGYQLGTAIRDFLIPQDPGQDISTGKMRSQGIRKKFDFRKSFEKFSVGLELLLLSH
jgi:hypothetical protein